MPVRSSRFEPYNDVSTPGHQATTPRGSDPSAEQGAERRHSNGHDDEAGGLIQEATTSLRRKAPSCSSPATAGSYSGATCAGS